MEQTINKLDASHDERIISMQGVKERDAWMRCIPHPIPDTHHVVIEWIDPMRLRIACVPKPAAAVAAETPETAPAVPPALAEASKEDLVTRAAELGVTVNPKWSRAQLVAAVAKAEPVQAGAVK